MGPPFPKLRNEGEYLRPFFIIETAVASTNTGAKERGGVSLLFHLLKIRLVATVLAGLTEITSGRGHPRALAVRAGLRRLGNGATGLGGRPP